MGTVHEGARKDAPRGEAYVVCTELDWCWTPAGDDMVLVGYFIAAYFEDAVSVAPTVTMTANETFTKKSRLSRVFGDEGGTGGGVQSGVNLGYCRPATHSDTVFAEGQNVVNDGSVFLMNCNGPDGPPNTVGELIYLEGGAKLPLGPQAVGPSKGAETTAPEEGFWTTAWSLGEKAVDMAVGHFVWHAEQSLGFVIGVGEGLWGTAVLVADTGVFLYDVSAASQWLTPGRYDQAAAARDAWGSAAAEVGGTLWSDPGLALGAAGAGLGELGGNMGGAFLEQPGRVIGQIAGGAVGGSLVLAPVKTTKGALALAASRNAGRVGYAREAFWKFGMRQSMPATVEQVQKLQGLLPGLLRDGETALKASLDKLKGIERQLENLKHYGHDGTEAYRNMLARQQAAQKEVASRAHYLESLKAKQAEIPAMAAEAQAAEAAERSAVRVLRSTGDLPKFTPRAAPQGAILKGTPDEIAQRVATQMNLSPAEHARLLESLKSGLSTGDMVAYFQTTAGDPVDVASGTVIDFAVDLVIQGGIPIAWSRSFSSAWTRQEPGDHGPGWYHAFEQVLVPREGGMDLRDHDGRWVHFPELSPGESFFHRGERLTLERLAEGYALHTTPRRTTRLFAASAPSGPLLLRAVRDTSGNALALAHDAEDRLVAIDNGEGRVLRITRSGGRVARIEAAIDGEPAGGVDFSYSDDGHLVSATDAAGHGERYEQDRTGHIVAITRRGGARFSYHHGPEDRCVYTGGEGGLLDAWLTFDPPSRTTTVGGAEPRRYTWNERGIVVREATLDGEILAETDHDHTTITGQRDAFRALRYRHDDRGNLVHVADGAGDVCEIRHEGDRPVEITCGGASLRLDHDDRGRLVALRGPSGNALRFTHDDRGRLLEARDDVGPLAAFTYDARGELLSEADARGARTTCARDAWGRITSITDPLGSTLHLRHDALGRPTSVQLPDGATCRVTWSALGLPETIVDRAGRMTCVEYTKTGKVRRVVSPDGRAWSFEHTPAERLCRVVNPRRESHRYAYDDAGRLVEESTLDGRRFEYDHTGKKLTSILAPDGSRTLLSYDARGRVVEERRTDMVLTFRYDAQDRLIEAALDEAGRRLVTSWEWNEKGRLAAVAQDGRRITFAHDARGSRTARVLPGGSETKYTYDAAGALASVEHTGCGLTFTRDLLGREIERRFRAGALVVRTERDAEGRIVQQIAADGAGRIVAQRATTYDVLGRPIAVDDLRFGATRYRYESDRLVEAARGDRAETFVYNRAGDLRGKNGARFLLRRGKVRRAGNVRFEHDACGRRTAKIETTRDGARLVTTYTWDSRDRLREAHLPDGRRLAFVHDAAGRCIRREVRSAEGSLTSATDYLWDGEVLAAEISEAGTREIVYEPGTFVPLLQIEAGHVLACLADTAGIPRELFDEDGQVVWAAAHGAWGDVVEAHASSRFESPFRLLGQHHDPDLDLCRTLHRWFDPSTGQWLSADPLGLAGGTSPFGFDGAPTADADPLGLAVIYSMTDNVHQIWSSQTFRGMTEGAVYGMRTAWAPNWRTMIDAKGVDPGMIVFTDDVAALFRPHTPVGAYSGLKWALGQNKAPFGDLRFTQAVLAESFNPQLGRIVPTIVVSGANVVPHAGQSTLWAASRLAGRAGVIDPLVTAGVVAGGTAIGSGVVYVVDQILP